MAQPTSAQLAQALHSAYQLEQSGQPAQAQAICTQILAVLPRQADAIHLLGVIALKDGDIDQAIEQFKRAIKSNPNHPQFNCNLGLALHERGELTLAAQHYRKAVSLNPQHVDAYYNLHALLLKTASLPAAIDNLSKTLQLRPDDHEARFMLAMVLEYGGQAGSQEQFAQIPAEDALLQSRLDAWDYFRNIQPRPALLGSNIATFTLAMAAAKVSGLVLEFGVRHGNSIKQLVRLAGGQQVHGFDSFEGLPEAWHAESKGSYSTRGKIPKVPPLVKLHAGWFDETLPAFLQAHPGPVRLLNVDCDIYSSTRTVLTQLAPRIVVGSVIIFDEYIGNAHWREDEFKAFQEAVAEYGWAYEYLSVSFFTKQVAVRITQVQA